MSQRGFKRGQMWETLVPWLLALLILVLVVGYYVILKGKEEGALTYLKNLVKFR